MAISRWFYFIQDFITFQKFTYSGGGNISYHEIDDWFTIKQFRFQPYPSGLHCFQFELYGCPEGKIK